MSRVMAQNPPTPNKARRQGNNLNFRLARDQAVHLETAANSCTRWRQANNVFAICFICETGSKKRTVGVSGKQNSFFAWGQ